MKLRITVLIPLILVFATFISSFIHYINASNTAEEKIRNDALHLVKTDITRLQNILYNYLTENKLELKDARLNLSVMAMDSNIKQLFIVNADDTVIIANRYSWEGENASNISDFNQGISHQAISTSTPVIFYNKENTTLLNGYFPVILQLEVSDSVHHKKLGTLFINYSIMQQLKLAQKEAALQSITFSLLMLLASAIVGILLHLLISQRLRKLIKTSKSLAVGDLTSRNNIVGKDELADLGNAFDDMATRLNEDFKRRKSAEEELLKLNETLEQRVRERTKLLQEAQRIAHIGHWNWSISNSELTLSDEVYRILELEPQSKQLTYRSFFDTFIHKDDIKKVESALNDSIKHKIKYSIDYRIQLNNMVKWVHAEGMPKYNANNKAVDFSGTFQDISKRKTIEESLLAAKIQAEESNKAKSEFLSRMSHELRTPMNAILGFSQILEMLSLTDEQTSFLKEITDAGDHLLTLISELLDLSRIESGRLSVEPENQDIASVVQQAINITHQIISERNITLSNNCSSDEIVYADPTRLKQVFVNLLSNAAKYNKKNGSINISCEQQNNNMLRVTITDTGTGIRQEQLPDLFIPFERLDAKYSAIDGAGIGLAITKQLIELMSGHIGVESVYGEGTTFWVDIPLGNFSDINKPEQQSSEIKNRVSNVLYIEDNAANLKVVETLIDQYTEFKLMSASNGEEGLLAINKNQPDIILLDINLPDTNGFDVIKTIKQNPQTKDIPIIIVSANAMPVDIEKALAAGCEKYITKPINLQELMEALKEAKKH